SEFVSAPNKSGPVFRVVLVLSIATVATVLLTLGGTAVVDTVQTGTIIGAFPFSFVIILMIINLIRRLIKRDKAIKQLEKDINNPDPNLVFVADPDGDGAILKELPGQERHT
ncbi:transporter, partial [Escherichia coli]|nr:transporter [Escherichia coli]